MSPKLNITLSSIGILIFIVLTIILPFVQILGGYLIVSRSFVYDIYRGTPYEGTYAEEVTYRVDYYWDHVESSATIYHRSSDNWDNQTWRYTYNEFLQITWFEDKLIWQLISLWGPIWILLGIIGACLMIFPLLQRLLGREPFYIAKIGLIVGLLASGGECFLFISAIPLGGWSTLLAGFNGLLIDSSPDINILLLSCFIIGWIGLIGSFLISKIEVPSSPENVG